MCKTNGLERKKERRRERAKWDIKEVNEFAFGKMKENSVIRFYTVCKLNVGICSFWINTHKIRSGVCLCLMFKKFLAYVGTMLSQHVIAK